jgi:hypothetical protein
MALLTDRKRRVDQQGRAFAGSQLQIQIYVARRQAELSAAVAESLSEANLAPHIRWVAPLEQAKFKEPYDRDFLVVLGLARHAAELNEFWPNGGPHWDALAMLGEDAGHSGVLLVEAKSYPKETYGPGCQAKDLVSRQKILDALDSAKSSYGVPPETNWTGSLYQYANRLAHVYFLRARLGVPAWLVNICFTGDSSTMPTTEDGWRGDLPSIKKELGFRETVIPWVVDVILPAHDRDELLARNAR